MKEFISCLAELFPGQLGLENRELAFHFLIVALCYYLPQDFLSPHVKLFNEQHFDELGLSVDLMVPVPNMEDVGYGVKTQSVNVMGGV